MHFLVDHINPTKRDVLCSKTEPLRACYSAGSRFLLWPQDGVVGAWSVADRAEKGAYKDEDLLVARGGGRAPSEPCQGTQPPNAQSLY